MTRVVSFADGFTSATPPNIQGTVQEDYGLANNLSVFTDIAGLIFDHTACKSVFVKAQLRRYHENDGIPEEFIGTSEFTLVYNEGWEIIKGFSTGLDMLQESEVVNNYDVALLIDYVTGQMRAKTGNMTGGAYEGDIKISATRIV